jgi:sulfoxide reductase heme-binding subunit YedZ
MAALSARRLKVLLWVGLSAPLLWLLVLIGKELQQTNSGLGAEPSEALLHYLGEWSLIVLLAALAVSPLRRRLHWPALGQNRRLIGLFAFFYVTLHVLTYLGLYVQFQMTELLDDFVHRPYITAGIAAFVALFLMAMTSTQWLAQTAEAELATIAPTHVHSRSVSSHTSTLVEQRQLAGRSNLPVGAAVVIGRARPV